MSGGQLIVGFMLFGAVAGAAALLAAAVGCLPVARSPRIVLLRAPWLGAP